MEYPLLITGGRVIDPCRGLDRIADLFIVEGKIAWLGDRQTAPPQSYTTLHADGTLITPGFIDLHCHLREPGFEEKETIATGTMAAARGGFTTLCCMANTDPPIDTKATVEYVTRKAATEGVVHVLPIGCISKGRRGGELSNMNDLAEAGVVAFSDDGDPVRSAQLMRLALEHSRTFGLPIINHCEDTTLTEGGMMNEGVVSARLGLRGMPAEAEEIMIARDILFAKLTGARLHIAHVSTAGSVELIRRSKEEDIPVTAEVTPHHLTMTEEWVTGRGSKQAAKTSFPYDTNAKVKPPLRTRRDVEALIRGLKEGVIDAIATDHAPHAAVDKLCEFGLAAFGISGLETALGSLMSLVHDRKLDLMTLVSKLTIEPSSLIRPRDGWLGTLKIDAPGDVTIFDPKAEWVVEPQAFASKGKNTPLAGCKLKGKVMATIVGGKIVYKDDSLRIEMP